jgi:hypothetical protein
MSIEPTGTVSVFVHYFQPDHLQATVTSLLALGGAVGTGGYFLGKFIEGSKATKTEQESRAQKLDQVVDDRYEKLIELLNQTNEVNEKNVSDMRIQMTNMEAKVNRLGTWLEWLACRNAPTCVRRDCPGRAMMVQMMEGDIMNVEDVATGKTNEDPAGCPEESS